MKKTFTKYEDPAHGWVKVPLELLKELGIEDQITGFSFMTFTDAYLEEDVDETTFVNAYKKKYGEFPKLNTRHANKESKCRSYGPYKSILVKRMLGKGRFILLDTGEQPSLYWVSYVDNKELWVQPLNPKQSAWRVSRNKVSEVVLHSFNAGNYYCEHCHHTESFKRTARVQEDWFTDEDGNLSEVLETFVEDVLEDVTCFACDEPATKIPKIPALFESKLKDKATA